MVGADVLVSRISEIADVVLMRYRLEPEPGIEFVSPSSLPILGYRPDEFYASPALGLQIVHPEDRERLAHECARDPEAIFIGRAVRKDGSVRWIERRQTRVADQRGEPAFLEATLRDVTVQRETEDALRASEQRWQTVFKSAHDVFLLVDDDRRLVAANDAAAEFFGIPVEQLIGRKVDQFTSDGTNERWAYLLRHGSLHNEDVWRRPDGKERRVRVSATANVAPGRHFAVVQDITEQRAMEEQLREIQLRFRTAFERAPIGMALVAIDGCWLEVNQAFCNFLGYTEDELCQTTWQALTHPDDLDADLASVEATLAGRIDGYTMEKRYLRKDREIVFGRLNVALVRTAEGEPGYFISQLEDIGKAPQSQNESLANPRAAAAEHGLTPRQTEILQLLAEGHSTSQIAAALYLSKTTVRNHIAHLFANLGVHTRVQAIVAGSRRGLITMPTSDAPPDT